MFGLYRLVLAIAVALSHVGFVAKGFNPGQWAVVCFYLLSGFLMERQFHKLAPKGGISSFYLDRFLRIYPVYGTVVLVSAYFTPATVSTLTSNLLLLPANYSEFTGVPNLIIPAFSLACEVHFYLLVPLFVILSTRILRFVIAASLALFFIAAALPHTAFWAYSGLLGILFTFLSGILINRREWSTLGLIFFFVATMGAFYMMEKMMAPAIKTGANINVCVGYMIAVPATVLLGKLSPAVAWDRCAGLLSYPLFLVHGLVAMLCATIPALHSTAGFIAMSLVAAALLVVTVEMPSDYLRYYARDFTRRSSPAT